MRQSNLVMLVAVVVCLISVAGCQDLVIDKDRLFRQIGRAHV